MRDPEDETHEKGTCQENQQVAMRRTTRDEKIVNPGVYEVPEFDCPRCGREWVGLTDDEIAQLMFKCDVIVTGPTQFDFARAIEAKLKEKNSG
jgi:hypothetical protein